jgi:hypothetical protein
LAGPVQARLINYYTQFHVRANNVILFPRLTVECDSGCTYNHVRVPGIFGLVTMKLPQVKAINHAGVLKTNEQLTLTGDRCASTTSDIAVNYDYLGDFILTGS